MLKLRLATPWELLVLFMVMAVISTSVQAEERVFTDEENLAIHGYDPVAYFTLGEPTAGSPEHEVEWHSARWRFVNEEHEALFVENPDRYAPRYGGFCASAMSLGWRGTADPQAWEIIDGRLYLAFSEQVMDEFAADADQSVAAADEHWVVLGPR